MLENAHRHLRNLRLDPDLIEHSLLVLYNHIHPGKKDWHGHLRRHAIAFDYSLAITVVVAGAFNFLHTLMASAHSP
jgi:hypothetical protein